MFLGIDLGTTNIKALLVRPDGRIVARGAAPVALHHVGPAGVEQDIEEIWRATLAAIRQATRAGKGRAVRAVGVSSQGGAMQVLDGAGQPLGRVISWLDGRGHPYDGCLTRRKGSAWFARHTGHGASAVMIGQVLRLRREAPSGLRPPNRVGFVGDVVVARLAGQGAHDASSLSIAMAYNPRERRADPAILKLMGLDESRLPALCSPREAAGALLKPVAAAARLPEGIPVSAAIHDQYAAALGAGVVRPGDVMFGAGTAWVLLAASARLEPPAIPSAFVCNHVIEGLYGQMLSMANGGSAFRWATRLMGIESRSLPELDALAERIPPGCGGVRFWPLLVAATPAGLPPGTAGRLTGLQLAHTGGHVLRAVVEGLAMELARYLGLLRRGGVPAKRLLMCGGATASRVTPQIIADVTGLPVVCSRESEMSALGAAMLARGLVEPTRGLAEISRAMAPPVRTFRPGPHAALYRRQLKEYVSSLPAL